MDLNHLEKKLLTAARASAPSDAVPYAFEQRIMARLQTLPMVDSWCSWGVALWRGAVVCVGVTLLCGLWTAFGPLNSTTRSSSDLSQDLEHTILASADEADTAW